MANEILTPHIGNATVEARDDMVKIVAQNVCAKANGTEVKYIMNPTQ